MLVLLLMEGMLADLGCDSVTAATNVGKALALLETHTFDAATLDMNLGGADTYLVADALAAHGVPFAFATGYTHGGVREGYGDRPLLKKPFGAAELSSMLARLLAQGAGQPATAIT